MPHDDAPDDLPDRLLKAAVKYAKRGWRVLPLRPGTKIPLLPEWQIEASSDPSIIRDWWARWPTANIGLATGEESGLYVLDVDHGHTKKAAKSIKRLAKKYGALPPTYTVKTPSGGLHHYFAWPQNTEGTWRNLAGTTLGLGVDVRAEGGQVAAPPSVLSDGSTYKRTIANHPVELPDWLAKLTRYVPDLVARRPSIDPASLSISDKDRLDRWTIAAVDGVVATLTELNDQATPNPKDYAGPPWNDTTFKAAVRLLEIARAPWSPLTESDAYDVLVGNSPRDRGFSDRDVELIWRSATKRVETKDVLPVPEQVAGLYLIPLPEGDARNDRVSPDSYIAKGDGLLAERLADTLMDDLAIGVDGFFWEYRAGVWVRDRNALLKRVTFALGDRYRPAHYAAVKDVVMASGRIPHLTADPNPDLINTRTGMVDWRTGAIVPHDPSYLSTVQLPVDYDTVAECPNFDRWLESVLDTDTVNLVWEVIGYLLMSGNPAQVAILFYGGGGNGKGTLLRLITRMLGRWNTSAVTLRSISEGKFEVAQLLGKIANIAGDIDARYLKDSSKFKALTGEDQVEAQHKYQDPFFFTNWAVPVFSANELWRSADTTEGYFDRWVTVPFPKKVRGLGNFDETLLHSEASGIMVKALESLRTMMSRGRFEMLGHAADLKREFAEQSDIMRLWIREDDHVLDAEAGKQGYGATKAKRKLLYDTFRDWARRSEHGVLSSTAFYQRLRRMGFIETRVSGVWHFYGIKLDIVDMTLPRDGVADYGLHGPADYRADVDG